MLRTVLAILLSLGGVGFAQARAIDPQTIADRIDAHLEARFQAEKIQPAPQADDAEFLRRAYLDLTGRIPRPAEVYAFLADPSPEKRAALIDELLRSPRYATHAAALWRATLAPETSSIPEARVFQPGFEAWLRQQFRTNVPYDRWVRELLTIPITNHFDDPTPVLRRPNDPNPMAFYAVKEAKPENLAAVTTRVFLGVQIECAQCHNHPFAPWTQNQFWNQAAFFAGIQRRGEGLFAPIVEQTEIREIQLPESMKRVPARYLDEPSPGVLKNRPLRQQLAAWVTDPQNPFFARTAANRVWAQLMGRGLVDPVDDFHDDNPPSHPELLEELAQTLIQADFDLQVLMRAIGRTKAYQRTSRQTDPSQAAPEAFARMAVKGFTGEQLFDSLVLATGYQESPGRRGPREQFLTRFSLTGKVTEPETSIPQALALMNGPWMADVTTLSTSPTLVVACELPGLSLSERVELLYLSALGRMPTPQESQRIQTYLDVAGPERLKERLADLFWALLNSAEFRLNH